MIANLKKWFTSPNALQKSYAKIRPGVVAFASELPVSGDVSRFLAIGSGICIDPSGVILTATHVLEDLPKHFKRKVVFSPDANGRAYACDLDLSQSVNIEGHDLSIVRITVPVLLPSMPLDCYDWKYRYAEGSYVAASGFPLRDYSDTNINPNLFHGIISRVPKDYVETQNGMKALKITHIILDINLHPGNSGGPVFDVQEGKFIGIVSSYTLSDARVQSKDGKPVNIDVAVGTNIIQCIPMEIINASLRQVALERPDFFKSFSDWIPSFDTKAFTKFHQGQAAEYFDKIKKQKGLS